MSCKVHKYSDLEGVVSFADDIKEGWGIFLIEVVFGNNKVSDGGFGGCPFHGAVDGYFLYAWLFLLVFLFANDQDLEEDEHGGGFGVIEEHLFGLECILMELLFIVGLRALDLNREDLDGILLAVLFAFLFVELDEIFLVVFDGFIERFEGL